MTQSALSCPKCNGEMIRGFVFDNTHNGLHLSKWTLGTPIRSTILGFNIAGIKIPKSGETIPIGTFRCQLCGYLESYAREEFAAK
jgi:hypothetical protein